jgi:hypothetical protein
VGSGGDGARPRRDPPEALPRALELLLAGRALLVRPTGELLRGRVLLEVAGVAPPAPEAQGAAGGGGGGGALGPLSPAQAAAAGAAALRRQVRLSPQQQAAAEGLASGLPATVLDLRQGLVLLVQLPQQLGAGTALLPNVLERHPDLKGSLEAHAAALRAQAAAALGRPLAEEEQRMLAALSALELLPGRTIMVGAAWRCSGVPGRWLLCAPAPLPAGLPAGLPA